MLKGILIVSAICLVYEFLCNLNDMIYLCVTNYKINTNKQISNRLIHIRRLCIRANVRINDLVFYHPENSENTIQDYVIQASGEYRRLVFQCINPIYWVKCILFLPQRIVSYFNFNVEGIVAKVFNLLYWVINILCQLYSDEVKSFIDVIIENVNFGG